MFDRAPFDQTLYDRTQDSQSVTALIRGGGDLLVGVLVESFIIPFNIKGEGNLKLPLIVRQYIYGDIVGKAEMSVSEAYMWYAISGFLDGMGDTAFELIMKDPIGDPSIDGIGELIESGLFFYQHTHSNLKGRGDFRYDMLLKMPIAINTMAGSGGMSVNNKLFLRMETRSSISGFGELILRRIGALNTEVLEFANLNLKPGQNMIIDTDELNVFIDNILNVDSVTEDSIFFQLKPGENEISFVSNGNIRLNVTVIWQNRWL